MADKEKKLIRKVKKASGEFPIPDYIEAIVDACMESEALKAIPVVSTGIATMKAFLQFKERKFKAKVELFTEAAGSFSDEEWKNFAETLSGEGKEEDFVNEILEVIERVDDEQKAKIIGGVFRRLVKRELSYSQFEDQVRITSFLQLVNIHLFMHGYHNDYLLEESLGEIMTAQRILKRKIELAMKTLNLSGSQKQYISVTFELTGIGRLYLASLHQVYEDRIDPDRLFKG